MKNMNIKKLMLLALLPSIAFVTQSAAVSSKKGVRKLLQERQIAAELADRVAVIHEEQHKEANGEPVTLYTPNPEHSLKQQLRAAINHDTFAASLIESIDRTMAAIDARKAREKAESERAARESKEDGERVMAIFGALNAGNSFSPRS